MLCNVSTFCLLLDILFPYQSKLYYTPDIQVIKQAPGSLRSLNALFDEMIVKMSPVPCVSDSKGMP